jgi:hypothetical protein
LTVGDPVPALILDLLEWVAPQPRRYSEVIDTWRTSCPRLPIWEEANERELVELRLQEGGVLFVCLTSKGREFLDRHRALARAPALTVDKGS